MLGPDLFDDDTMYIYKYITAYFKRNETDKLLFWTEVVKPNENVTSRPVRIVLPFFLARALVIITYNGSMGF
jgi:hypothetical protein